MNNPNLGGGSNQYIPNNQPNGEKSKRKGIALRWLALLVALTVGFGTVAGLAAGGVGVLATMSPTFIYAFAGIACAFGIAFVITAGYNVAKKVSKNRSRGLLVGLGSLLFLGAATVIILSALALSGIGPLASIGTPGMIAMILGGVIVAAISTSLFVGTYKSINSNKSINTEKVNAIEKAPSVVKEPLLHRAPLTLTRKLKNKGSEKESSFSIPQVPFKETKDRSVQKTESQISPPPNHDNTQFENILKQLQPKSDKNLQDLYDTYRGILDKIQNENNTKFNKINNILEEFKKHKHTIPGDDNHEIFNRLQDLERQINNKQQPVQYIPQQPVQYVQQPNYHPITTPTYPNIQPQPAQYIQPQIVPQQPVVYPQYYQQPVQQPLYNNVQQPIQPQPVQYVQQPNYHPITTPTYPNIQPQPAQYIQPQIVPQQPVVYPQYYQQPVQQPLYNNVQQPIQPQPVQYVQQPNYHPITTPTYPNIPLTQIHNLAKYLPQHQENTNNHLNDLQNQHNSLKADLQKHVNNEGNHHTHFENQRLNPPYSDPNQESNDRKSHINHNNICQEENINNIFSIFSIQNNPIGKINEEELKKWKKQEEQSQHCC